MNISDAVEAGSIKPPALVPISPQVQVPLPSGMHAEEQGFEWIAEFAGCLDSLPVDGAQYHTDYAAGRKPRP